MRWKHPDAFPSEQNLIECDEQYGGIVVIRETIMRIQNSRIDQKEKPRKISYYTADGEFKEQQDLNYDNLGNTNGMMIRCFMQNGNSIEGFADPYRTHGMPPYDGSIHDDIYLWTWDHLDEGTHQLVGDNVTKFDQTFVPVPIQEIIHIDAILYSNPHWGGMLTNRFFIDII